MTFRKNSISFYESQISYLCAIVLCLILIPLMDSFIPLLICSPFVLLLFVTPKLWSQFITIDETGVFCHRSGKQIWGYQWNEIAVLKRTSECLLPVILVVKYGQAGILESTKHSFELGRVARKAIATYSDKVIKESKKNTL